MDTTPTPEADDSGIPPTVAAPPDASAVQGPTGVQQIAANESQQQPQVEDDRPQPMIQGGDQSPAPAPAILRPVPSHNIFKNFLDMLGGATDHDVYQDDQGNKFIQTPDRSTGKKWVKIGSDLLQGAAAGLVAGQGVNGKGKALAAGLAKGGEIAQADQDRVKSQEAEVRQNQLDQFNHTMLQQKVLENSLALTRMGTEATDEAVKQYQAAAGDEEKMGSIPLGTYKDVKDLAGVRAQHPDVIQDWMNTKNIVAIPHVDPETGVHDGVSLYLRRQDAGKEALPPGTPFRVAVKDAKGVPTVQTVQSAGPMTRDELTSYNSAADAAVTSYHAAQAEQAKKDADLQHVKAETTEQNASAAEKYANAAETRQSMAPPTASADGTKINGFDRDTLEEAYQGRINLSQFSPRIPKNGGMSERMRALQAINALHPGANYDETTWSERNKTAKDFSGSGQGALAIQSFDQLGGHLLDFSNGVNDLRNTNQRWLNMPINKLRQMTNNPEISAYILRMDAAKHEVANALNNNHALHEDDIDTINKVFSENQTPAQAQAAAKQAAHTVLVRAGAVNDTYKAAMDKDAPNINSRNVVDMVNHFGLQSAAQAAGVGTRQQSGMVTVQIPGAPPGQIPAAQLDAFKRTHPNAQVTQ